MICLLIVLIGLRLLQLISAMKASVLCPRSVACVGIIVWSTALGKGGIGGITRTRRRGIVPVYLLCVDPKHFDSNLPHY